MDNVLTEGGQEELTRDHLEAKINETTFPKGLVLLKDPIHHQRLGLIDLAKTENLIILSNL